MQVKIHERIQMISAQRKERILNREMVLMLAKHVTQLFDRTPIILFGGGAYLLYHGDQVRKTEDIDFVIPDPIDNFLTDEILREMTPIGYHSNGFIKTFKHHKSGIGVEFCGPNHNEGLQEYLLETYPEIYDNPKINDQIIEGVAVWHPLKLIFLDLVFRNIHAQNLPFGYMNDPFAHKRWIPFFKDGTLSIDDFLFLKIKDKDKYYKIQNTILSLRR